MKDAASTARLLDRLRGAYAAEEREGLMLAAKVRSWALLVVIIWQVIDNPLTGAAYFYVLGELVVMLGLGLAQFAHLRWWRVPVWVPFVWVVADVVFLTIIFNSPNPFEPDGFAPAAVLRGSSFVWFFILLMQATFSSRPLLVLWCGFCIVSARLSTLFWVLSKPGIFSNFDHDNPSIDYIEGIYFDPNFVFLGDRINEILAITLTAAGLAVVVARTRRFVEGRAQAERARSKLARYFSPNVVDEISSAGGISTAAHDQDVAVLFTDIIGFTRLCETEPAEKVVALLREYHRLLADTVFRHQGTLDKYIGDALMATFGTPRTGSHDATDALACVLEMVDALSDWNKRREAAGETSVTVGVGLHYGVVVIGDIGDERRLEFAVIGDTVNVASRVEHLTRDLKTPLTVSEDLVEAVRREAAEGGGALLAKLTDSGPQPIRGRQGKIGIWVLAEPGGG